MKREGLLIGMVLALAAIGSAAAQPAAVRIGDYRTSLRGLRAPMAVAVAPDGTVLVAESGADRIARFDPTGRPRDPLGGPGPITADGTLLAPSGVAVAADGTVVVADTGHDRIQLFDADGGFRAAWGTRGGAAGELAEPRGVAVRGQEIFVADTGNDRVQVFDRDGNVLLVLGGFGHDDGQFNRPTDVDVAADGTIFVSDTDNNRIQIFEPDGAFRATWGDFGPFPGLLDEPGGLVAWGDDVFVADRRNHRVQITAADGTLRTLWGTHALEAHAGEGLIHYPSDLAFAPDGTFAVLCEPFENRCQLFDLDPFDGTPEQPKFKPVPVLTSHFGDRLSIGGRLLAAGEPELYRLHLFQLGRDVPILIGDYGERGTRPGQSVRAAGIAVDGTRHRVYTTDLSTRRLQSYNLEYDPDAPTGFAPHRFRLRRSLDLAAQFDRPWPPLPVAVVLDGVGNVYVLDARNAVIDVFDPELRHRNTFGGYGMAAGLYRGPTDLAFGADGTTLYVVDALNHRVQILDRDGTPRGQFGSRGEDDGAFGRPFGIAAGADGAVYVSDPILDRVQKFTADGTFLAAWGEHGVEHGQFWSPRGLAQDAAGRVYVMDYGNHRIQVFRPEDGTWLVTFGTGRAWTNREALRSAAGAKP